MDKLGNIDYWLRASEILAYSAAGLALYLLPWLIAWARRHRNTTAIAVLTVLTGWTFAGWVVALVWALHRDRGRK